MTAYQLGGWFGLLLFGVVLLIVFLIPNKGE